ncbi:hypothetical protein OU994_28965 [Pseudoduganella sp. SL102]|uniref:esterase/lipase family protein n=1 Tax=Pseudoduganella sp. SL102 TaxID=2995154 RepID=UPI00248BD58D|nr:hypothetical protein [Pseudoduganella sp. SL102]WBS02234.1 hypothetical protein OU994_28965 [Pseudoduganella sp. SL102]
MSMDDDLNERGNHRGHFTQGVGGWAEYNVHMTEICDKVRHDVCVPPGKVIPVIFLPGVMGSNLRLSKARQAKLKRDDNRSWRPDDLITKSGASQILTETGYGGWLRNASPAERQLNFDPNETEVEYYHYTESKDRFDPEGKETLASDARHQNVPDTLAPIPPLLGQPWKAAGTTKPGQVPKKQQSAAQVARWRGWSELFFTGPYSEMLKTTEAFLNNIVRDGEIQFRWRKHSTSEDGKPLLAAANRGLSHLLLQPPTAFGGKSGAAITEADLKMIAPCWYPVHAMGYNFLKSNGECARVIAERIRGLVKGYVARGFKCDEVIVVTHSMGGLLARALIHPDYGNLLADQTVKVLGMYHSAMPVTGAAATYKRMRFGFREGNSPFADVQARLFGLHGADATAILANAPGPLELLPSEMYGKEWLRLHDYANRLVSSWPRVDDSSLQGIYLQSAPIWWRLINPDWVNLGNVKETNGGGIRNVMMRLVKAYRFTQAISSTFHPNASFASYCDSSSKSCYGEVILKISEPDVYGGTLKNLPPPDKWILVSENGRGGLTVQAGSRLIKISLQQPNASGDETVPSARSAQHIKAIQYIHGRDGGDYEHQASFSEPQVLVSLLYSIVQIAKKAHWAK